LSLIAGFLIFITYSLSILLYCCLIVGIMFVINKLSLTKTKGHSK
jgi:hypothetical protein